MKLFLYYLFVINMIAIILYGVDKVLAIAKKRRISERSLFFIALFGGPIGSIIGMFLFRHKIKKLKFHLWNIACLIAWLYLLYRFMF